MKKNILSLILASLALLFAGTACEKEFDTVLNHELSQDTDVSEWLPTIEYGSVRLGTFNVLYGAYADSENYKWAVRKNVLAQAIVANDFDIAGLQEVDKTVRTELPNLIDAAKPTESTRNYQYWFLNRDKQEADSESSLAAVGEGLGIMYDANKFTLSDKHYFWLSPTPDQMSTGWDETKYHRIAACAIVTQNDNPDKRFFLMVTHAPLGDGARSNSAPLLSSRAALYNPDNLPAFLVGDMNATPSDGFSTQLVSTTDPYKWNDAFVKVPASAKAGGVITFHGKSDISDTVNPDNRIDYIYYKNVSKLNSYKVDYNRYNGYYPSDHCAVSVTFDIPSATPLPPTPGGEIYGSGTAADPYQIASAAAWATVAESINKDGAYAADAHYILTANLQFAGDFVRIQEFSGVLEGANYSMTGITGDAEAEAFGGVINVLKDGGVVKNLHVESNLSSAFINLGGVVGKALEGSLIDGVTFQGDLTGTGDCSRIGGIVGTGYGTIVNCGCLGGNFVAGSATKSENMGGIAGRIENASGATRPAVMANCYSWLDKIVSSHNNLGGITGGLGSAAYCVNVYGITADITGGGSYGSCIGYSKKGNIRNVYANEDAACALASSGSKWVASDKQDSDWYTKGAALTLANMKAGAVTLPSSGVEYESFVAALNAGIADWTALAKLTAMTGNKDTEPYGVLNKPDVTLREWEFDATTGYPVLKAAGSGGGGGGGGGDTPGTDPVVVTVNIKDYAAAHSSVWTDNAGKTAYTIEENGITLTPHTSGSANGVWYVGKDASTPDDWRIYQARGGFTLSVSAGHQLVKAVFTFSWKDDNVSKLVLNETQYATGEEIPLSGDTAEFTAYTADGKAQVRISEFTIEYK